MNSPVSIFIVLAALPGLDLREAALCAEELRREIERVPLNCAAGEIGITASFGVAESRLDGAPFGEYFYGGGYSAVYLQEERAKSRKHRFLNYFAIFYIEGI